MIYEKTVTLGTYYLTPAMKSCIVAFAAGFSLILSAPAQAQLLTRDCAANDSMEVFEKRMPSKHPEIIKQVREAEITGWNLYRYEALQNIAETAVSDAIPFEKRNDIKGSIVIPGATTWTIRFYSADGTNTFAPAADVVFESETSYKVISAANTTAFSDSETALIKATELISAKEPPCEGPFKIIVMPATDGSCIHAYQIREGMRSMGVPEGQHIRYDVSTDGTQVLNQQEYSRRCNFLATRESDEKNSMLEVANVSNTLFPQPSDLHVYLSLRYGVDIYLATLQSNLYWHIDRGIVRVDL